MTVSILLGDCRRRLDQLDAGSVDMVLTSPPYFRQRDYAAETTAKYTVSKEAARAYLIELGIHTADGQLTPEYGGPEIAAEQKE